MIWLETLNAWTEANIVLACVISLGAAFVVLDWVWKMRMQRRIRALERKGPPS